MTQKITILVPNYKTLELTKLCLRLLRKYTDPSLAHVIVIDNNSQDESTEYLRSLDWIELIERAPQADDTPPLSHSRALDLAMERVTTPYVLSIHTDTMVKRKDWLTFLLSHIENKKDIAGIGSWKLESKPLIKRLAKSIERKYQTLYYRLINKQDHRIEGVGRNYYYPRSHCALFRMDVIRELNTGFSDEQDVAGRVMYRKIKEAGYRVVFLPSEILSVYADHINHATIVLNPELGGSASNIRKGTKRIKRGLKELKADKILADSSLDK